MLPELLTVDGWVALITNPRAVALIVFSLLMLYLFVPVLLIRIIFSLKYPTTVVQFDLNDVDLPPDARRYLFQCDKSLRDLGYEPVACFGLPDLVPNVQSISALFVNRATQDGAIVNLIYAADGMSASNVEFCRRYVTGGMLCTNNSSNLSAFKNPENHHTFYYPDISDIAQLHRIHCCIDKHLGYGKSKLSLYDDHGGDIELYVQQEVIFAPSDYQCRVGRFYRTTTGFNTTLKGALFVTWGEMFPFKQIRRALEKRRANLLADRLCGIKEKPV